MYVFLYFMFFFVCLFDLGIYSIFYLCYVYFCFISFGRANLPSTFVIFKCASENKFDIHMTLFPTLGNCGKSPPPPFFRAIIWYLFKGSLITSGNPITRFTQ